MAIKRVYKPRRFQYGGTQFPVYRGLRQQRGHGIGGLFRGLFRTIAPMLKTGLKKGLTHVGRRALTAGANALADISENNTSIKDAFKKQAKSELAALNPINRIRDSLISNSPVKTRKRAASEKRSTTKTKRKKAKFSKLTL